MDIEGEWGHAVMTESEDKIQVLEFHCNENFLPPLDQTICKLNELDNTFDWDGETQCFSINLILLYLIFIIFIFILLYFILIIL